MSICIQNKTRYGIWFSSSFKTNSHSFHEYILILFSVELAFWSMQKTNKERETAEITVYFFGNLLKMNNITEEQKQKQREKKDIE